MNKDKIQTAINAMLEGIPECRMPYHITNDSLEDINKLIDGLPNRYDSTTFPNFIYRLKEVLKLLTPKPPQKQRFITVSSLEVDKKFMSVWKDRGYSSLVEVRIDEASGERLELNAWSQIDMSADECFRLLGVNA